MDSDNFSCKKLDPLIACWRKLKTDHLCKFEIDQVVYVLVRQDLIDTHKVAFTDFQTIVPKNRIGGGDMEEKLRQTVVEQVGVTNHFFLFGCVRA